MLKDVLKNLKQHCMSGISYMIPVIVIGGFCTALARLAGEMLIQQELLDMHSYRQEMQHLH